MERNPEDKHKKPVRIFKDLQENSMEFCRCTSLHGLQYLGEPNRPKRERLFWLVAFMTSLGLVMYFIWKVWYKWNTTPVFVSFSENTTPVWDIPFPAITICPQIKVRQTKFNFTEMCYNTNKSEEDIDKFEKARLVCRNFIDFGIDINEFFPLGYEPSGNPTVEGMIEFLEEMSPPVEEVVFICRWRGANYNCSELFKPVLTDDGLCFSFNTLNAKQMFREGTVQRVVGHLDQPNSSLWTFEEQYSDTDSNDVYPRRAATSGGGGGLLLMVTLTKEDVDPLCSPSVHGVKVVFSNPADYPASVQDQYFRLPVDRDVVVGIKPRILTTNVKLRDYNPQRRQCYFSNERQLRYFSVYTQQNCNLECFTNYTLRVCGCVVYYMPRTPDVPVCSVRKLNCTENTSLEFTTDDSGMEECNCLPSCTEIKYDLETSQAMFKVFDSYNALTSLTSALGINKSDAPEELFSTVTFFYKDNQFVTSHRSELYGPIDFLASCGGLLGLYLGFSFLSLVEIIYFFTMRFFSKLRSRTSTESL